MADPQLAELSRTLFWPWTFLLYTAAMVAYFYRLAFTKVDRDAGDEGRVGVLVGRLGVVLLTAGLLTHLGSLVTRSIAAGGREPWGNMYEYSSVLGFGVVVLALILVHWRMKRPELVGFLTLAALLMMASAIVLYTPAGPLMPALQTHWMKIHVVGMMVSSTIFIVAFIFTGLYLIRDHAESRVAAGQAALRTGSTVGAAYAPDAATARPDQGDAPGEGDTERIVDREVAGTDLEDLPEPEQVDDPAAYARALRRSFNPIPVAIGAAAIALAYSLLFRNTIASIVAPSVVAVGVLLAWWTLPKLPSAATLDSLAYRTTAFAFPILTFGVIAGAIWAEQSWGRYWGWDPKETGAFLTWIAYAGYLHARATRGLRGRGAAGIGVLAFLILMFTYYAVNLWITGLHSYAGTGASASNPPYAGIAGALALYGVVKLATRWSDHRGGARAAA
jgi:cytochrome c-type biogenesis protein CcsB